MEPKSESSVVQTQDDITVVNESIKEKGIADTVLEKVHTPWAGVKATAMANQLRLTQMVVNNIARTYGTDYENNVAASNVINSMTTGANVRLSIEDIKSGLDSYPNDEIRAICIRPSSGLHKHTITLNALEKYDIVIEGRLWNGTVAYTEVKPPVNPTESNRRRMIPEGYVYELMKSNPQLMSYVTFQEFR